MDKALEVGDHQCAFSKDPKAYHSSRLLPYYATVHRGVGYERRSIVIPRRLANPELLGLGVGRETIQKTIQAEKRRRATSNVNFKGQKE